MPTLVNIRCHNRHILARIDAAPEDWSGTLTVSRCGKCDVPSADRLVDVLIASGRDSFALGIKIPWSELRPYIETARRRGKPSDFVVRVGDA